jgi:hypothetical protein
MKDLGVRSLDDIERDDELYQILSKYAVNNSRQNTVGNHLGRLLYQRTKVQEVQEGTGQSRGLSNIDINKAMRYQKKNGFVGVYAVNQLDQVPETPETRSFIMNTESFPGDGHWVAVRLDKDTAEYYDPFGTEPSEEFITWAKTLPDEGLKQFKINSVVNQADDTDTCGLHAMNFLKKRSSGKTFIQATGFKPQNNTTAGEKEASQLKKRIKQFGYI